LYRALHQKLYATDYLTNFGQYWVQRDFAALDGIGFHLSDIAQDLPALTDMHVPTLVRMLNVLLLLVSDLCELLQILSYFIHSA